MIPLLGLEKAKQKQLEDSVLIFRAEEKEMKTTTKL